MEGSCCRVRCADVGGHACPGKDRGLTHILRRRRGNSSRLITFVRVKQMTLKPQHTPTSVFISYSWDSGGHKKWVLAFAKRLREHGIDAIIDQTHLPLGARTPEFMERSVRDSARVLVVCTEGYKQRFDSREGGAGYEGHIVTGEIVNEVGKNKFIPVLRNGDWKSAVPTALLGVHGVDLRKDAPEEYVRLIGHLHNVSHVPPIGPPPAWLDTISEPVEKVVTSDDLRFDPIEYSLEEQTVLKIGVLKKIVSKPHWYIWIRPLKFSTARFQGVEQCRQFMLSSYVLVPGLLPYPWVSTETLKASYKWIAGEIDHSDHEMGRAEHWNLFRSGQFCHYRSFDEIPQLGERLHALCVLDTTTAAFEFAARMADRGVLSSEAKITFALHGVDGRGLTWPQDVFSERDSVGPNCWCPEERVHIVRLVVAEEIKRRRRELALEVALEIYSRFMWSDPPIQRLSDEQRRRFGAVG